VNGPESTPCSEHARNNYSKKIWWRPLILTKSALQIQQPNNDYEKIQKIRKKLTIFLLSCS